MSTISKNRRRLVGRLASRRGREREGLALAEGPRVILEALGSPVEVRWVVVGEEFGAGRGGGAIVAACRERGVEVGLAPDAEVGALCRTDAPQPAVACVRPPPLEARSLERGRHLMAVGVQIPGNLGTLIRSAWAFGLDGVVVGAGTVDPWNPKVVRASAGGVFHVALIAEPEGMRATLLCADASGELVEEVVAEGLRDWVLMVGGEVEGVPAALGARARAVAVPLVAGVDSLNVGVAGSILMYALTGVGEGGAEG